MYHANIISGFEEYVDDATGLIVIKVPYLASGGQITPTIAGFTKIQNHPAGAFHNGAETKFKPNPDDDPKLIYQAGLTSSIARSHDEAILEPEFIDSRNLIRVKNYLVYEDTLTTAEYDRIIAFIIGNWTPLSERDDMVSYWDVRNGNDLVIDDADDAKGMFAIGVEATDLPITGITNVDIETFDYTDGVLSIETAVGDTVCNLDNIVDEDPVTNNIYELSFDLVINSGSVYVGMGADTSKQINRSEFILYTTSGRKTFTMVYNGAVDATVYTKIRPFAAGSNLVLSNITFKKYAGNNMVEYSKPPAFTGSNESSVLIHNGIDEFHKLVVDSTNYQDLTYGEYWAPVYVDQSNLMRLLQFCDNGGSTNNRIELTIASDGKLFVYMENNAVVSHIRTQAIFSVGWHVIGVRLTGSAYSINVDGLWRSLDNVTGNTVGLMVGGLTNKTLIDIVSIASNQVAAPNYTPTRFKAGIFKSAATSPSYQARLRQYWKVRYGITN